MRERCTDLRLRNAEDHTLWSGGVDEGAKDVEHTAEGEGFAVGRDTGEGGVVVGCEDEREGDAGDEGGCGC